MSTRSSSREQERHFNTLQAGIRALASGWLLASFGAIGLLLKESEDERFMIPQQWLVVSVCCVGTIGVSLLWVIDHLVYHRLLNAGFLVGLRLEHLDSRVPPVRSIMMTAAKRDGTTPRRLGYFYATPVAAFGIAAIATTTYYASTRDGSALNLIAMYGVAAATCVASLTVMYRQRDVMVYSQFGHLFGNEEFARLVGSMDFSAVLERYGAEPSRCEIDSSKR